MRILDSVFFRNVPRSSEGGAGAGGGAGGSGAGGNGAGGGAGSAGGGGAGAGSSGGGGGAGAGSNDQGWWRGESYAKLDADTQKFLDGKNYPDVGTALSSLRSADQMARDRNVIAKPDAKNLKGWGGYTELGWNADRQQYKLEAPKLGDGEAHDAKAFAAFENLAHEARLAPWQAQAVYEGMHRHTNETLKAFRDAGAAASRELGEQLKGKWGDKYDANTELAKRAFAFFKPDAITGAQMDQIMGAPAMVELFQKIGAAMGEDRLVGGGSDGFGGKTPAQARAERLQMEADPEFGKILKDPRHPKYQDSMARRAALLEIEARK